MKSTASEPGLIGSKIHRGRGSWGFYSGGDLPHPRRPRITQGQIVGDEGKSKGAEKYGTKKSIFFRPFRLSLVPFICPWVSEDGFSLEINKLGGRGCAAPSCPPKLTSLTGNNEKLPGY